jgi:hypothetical protein
MMSKKKPPTAAAVAFAPAGAARGSSKRKDQVVERGAEVVDHLSDANAEVARQPKLRDLMAAWPQRGLDEAGIHWRENVVVWIGRDRIRVSLMEGFDGLLDVRQVFACLIVARVGGGEVVGVAHAR